MKQTEVAINPNQLVRMYLERGILDKAEEYAALRTKENQRLSRKEIDLLLRARIKGEMDISQTVKIIERYGASQEIKDSLVLLAIRLYCYSDLLRLADLRVSKNIYEKIIKAFLEIGDAYRAEKAAQKRVRPGLTCNERNQLVKKILADKNSNGFYDCNSGLLKQGISSALLERLIKRQIQIGICFHGIDWIATHITPLTTYRSKPGIRKKEFDSILSILLKRPHLTDALSLIEKYEVSPGMIEKFMDECLERKDLFLAVKVGLYRAKPGLTMSEVRKLIRIRK